ncbi:hypothetical protein [Sphingobacterium siyangense]|uniref:hypothetical protein n=1 Tax=Sphingobacterium siyangense TaxID=459529 RepID=UPI003DA53C16
MKNEKPNKPYTGRPVERKPKSFVSANNSVYPRPEKAEGCKGSRRRKPAVRSTGNTSIGFLKQCFLPLIEEKEMKRKDLLSISKEMDKDYKDSLFQLKQYYNMDFREANTGQLAFDWLIDYDKICMLLNSGEHMEVKIVRTELGRIVLMTRQTFPTGHSLYYMPVLPLYRFLKDKRFHTSRPAVLVLLSACSYLYRHAGVPLYTQPDSYMDYEYEILVNWCEEEEEAKSDDLKELRQIMTIGHIMQQKFHHKNNLVFLKKRLEQLHPQDEFDRFCQTIGNQTLALYEQYPDENIFRLAATVSNNEYDYHYTTLMENYIAFTGTSEGGIADMLLDMVNNEFAENYYFQEPEIVQVFDGTGNVPFDFTFEHAVFKLLEDVCTVLNNY